jgi:hypothetical protein
LVNHHEAYLSWDEFRQNQRRLRQNWFRSMTRGAAREGTALLQGIAWCGRCGARMQVNSYSVKEGRKPSYICTYRYSQEGDGRVCQGMSSTAIDEVVVAAFLDAMQPAQLAVSAKVIDQLEKEKDALKRQWEKQLAQARYEAQLAQRQYDAVDPDNRAVAQTLERRWNEKLEALERLETAFAEAEEQERFQLTADERARIGALAQDLPKVWTAATTTDRERKELLRYAISEVQLDGVGTPGQIEIRIMWRSGAVTVRRIDRLPVGAGAPRTAEAVVERIRELAPDLSAHEIAERLDQEGLRSAHGKPLREHHVLYICRTRGIPVRPAANQQERSHLH